jgi:hypothetical protein
MDTERNLIEKYKNERSGFAPWRFINTLSRTSFGRTVASPGRCPTARLRSDRGMDGTGAQSAHVHAPASCWLIGAQHQPA